MPRPRVRPENRKRCAKACVQCRMSKKRCNSIHPCQKCTAKGEAALCVFAVEGRSPDDERATTTPIARTRARRTAAAAAAAAAGPLPVTGQRSIMLRTSLDERVFFGNTAAISFLKFLQQTWRTYVEPNSFTEDPGTQKMLEAELPRPLAPLTLKLDAAEQRNFMECYLHASSGILDLFTENDIERLLESHTDIQQYPPSQDTIVNPETNPDICLDLMFAIGTQCHARSDQELYLATAYFTRAQKSAFAGMLQEPTVNLARAFVLMAFYMLGACNRNSALMYIGVASNTSMILGLHSPENYQHLPREKREARLQTGKSVRVLDLICNTILGRPGSTPVIRDEREFLDGEICPNYAALCAMYEIVAVLQSVVNNTKEKEGIPIDTAEEYLQQLQKWSYDLPSHLRRQSLGSPSARPSLETKRATVGKIHLACIYYYGVIQVTRQSLVDQIIPHVRGEIIEERADEKTAKLATMFTEAALLMAQICDDAETASALLSNMCILKAWLFSSGLVLGFSLLQPHDHKKDTRQAFQSTCQILRRFGLTSPQAKQYHCVLSSFAEAIDTHERKSRSERSRLKSSQVETILSFDPDDSQETRIPQPQREEYLQPEGSEVYTDADPLDAFQTDELAWQWDWPASTGDNEILRMFLDPCLNNLMSLPPVE
ncbi:hypothetical protein BO71DRAFT_342138 [Aspergillus ellipticus CBS 707.79]|uniref:Zn(2)-C6 fungal-type domain-containing protein n=1 Tax=Aspergillus ellipticus CBS 707.79 TaxID=1448320 RepID=A0A319DQQ9_9EURO|nr:hypothetical protein BO71DRAFT_342138 [Aspergillus ellipticus CBS 707.79]